MNPDKIQQSYADKAQVHQKMLEEKLRMQEELHKFQAVVDAVDKSSESSKENTKKLDDCIQEGSDKVTKQVKSGSDRIVATLENTSKATNDSLTKLIQATIDSQDQELLTVVSNFTTLLNGLNDAIGKIENGPLHELPMVNKELGMVLEAINKELTEKEEPDYTECFKELEAAVKAIDVKPVVNVKKETIDISPIVDMLSQVKEAVIASEVEMPETDYSPIIVALTDVQDTIANLKFPSPNYVLPYKTSDGTATQGTARVLSSNIVDSDVGVVTNTVIHGKTTGGGGGYVDVKVNPSGALTTDATISGNVFTEAAVYDKRLDDFTTGGVIYIGEASIGTATNSAHWRIKRLDTSAGLVVQWADAGNFNQIWDNRASLTYN